MSSPDFFEVVHGQRAHRWFGPEPVPDDDLREILAAATRAPSAENTQPWVFVVVRDPERRQRIADLAESLWDGGARAHAEANVDAAMLADLDGSIAAGFGGAPVLVVVGCDTDRVHTRTVGSSIFPAVQNLLLAAGALGYGSAMTTLATLVPDALQAIVELPPSVEPVAVVPIGRPAAPLGRSRREPVSAKAHRDRFGDPFDARFGDR